MDLSAEWAIATVFAAFVAAFLGATAGWWLQRGAQLREARVRIYEDYLDAFHDLVNNTRRTVEKTGEPQTPDHVSALITPFARAATVSSSKDRAWVMPVWGRVERISERYRVFQKAAEPPEGRTAEVYRHYASEVLPLWNELNEYLWRYKGWLEWKFTRHGLLPLRPKPPIRNPHET